MAKATHAQEISTGTSASFTEHEYSDSEPGLAVAREIMRINRPMLGEVDKSLAGTDSSESLSTERQENETSNLNLQEPVQTTESLSNRTATADSDADSTDGNGLTQEEVPPYSEWTYAELQAECKARELPASGKTEELIARLEDSDELSEEPDDFE
jgi:SAP domain-containing protein